MENPYEPEKPQPEGTHIRPPGVEMSNGLLIFMMVFLVFLVAQVATLMIHIRSVTPALADVPLTHLLGDERFSERWNELSNNGDSIAWVELFSGGTALAVLLLVCRWWKGDRLVQFLGLRPPALKPFLAWCGLFVAVFVVLEVIANFLPDMNSDFMEKVLASITNYPLFYLGSCFMPALFEELLFRGLLLGSLRHLLDKNTAVAITAGLFTFTHMQYEWYLLLLNLLPLAVFLGYARTNTGSLWTGVFLHFVNNAASVILPMYFGANTP
jgi:membrane protease YdiL (CAAX protease family)